MGDAKSYRTWDQTEPWKLTHTQCNNGNKENIQHALKNRDSQKIYQRIEIVIYRALKYECKCFLMERNAQDLSE